MLILRSGIVAFFRQPYPCACVLVAGLVLQTSLCSAQVDLQPQPEEFRAQYFSTEDGLPSSHISSIIEDSLGFLWIGTNNGLVRFDGYQFKVYPPRPDDPTTIDGNPLSGLHLDASGRLWVGGGYLGAGGLSRYDPDTERFTHFRHDPENPNSLVHDGVIDIVGSQREPGVLWIATLSYSEVGGLSRFDTRTGTFTNFVHNPADSTSLPHNGIWSLLEDHMGTLWVGTSNGLARYNSEDGTFTSFQPESWGLQSSNFEERATWSLLEDHGGTLWISTLGALHRVDRERERLERIAQIPLENGVLGSYRIYSMMEDRTGTLWIGSHSGLHTYNRHTGTLDPFDFQLSDAEDLTGYDGTIFHIYEDRRGAIWVGGNGEKGLLRLERHRNPFRTAIPHLPPDRIYNEAEARNGGWWAVSEVGEGTLYHVAPTGEVVSYSLDVLDRGVTSLYEDRTGTLWLGTCGERPLHQMKPDQPGRIAHVPGVSRCVNEMLEDRQGRLWIATWGNGLYRLERKEDGNLEIANFRNDPENPNSLGNDVLLSIYEAPSEPDVFWIGSEGGLSRFDTRTEMFTNYLGESFKQTATVAEDTRGGFWFGTRTRGLYRFSRKTGTIEQSYSTHNGLPSRRIGSLETDDRGYLWFTTDQGLTRFDPDTEIFRTYTGKDGVPGNPFGENRSLKRSDGELVFGEVAFRPEDIVDQPTAPRVVLTGLQVRGEPVAPGPDAPLEVSIQRAESVTLPHDENSLQFDYVGLRPRDPERQQYQYIMENYDDDWVPAGTQRTARYPRLPPGNYTFRVRAMQSDGLWSTEHTSIRVNILPPWWRTTWAYLVYGLILIAGVIAADRIQRRRLMARERERVRERELEQARKLERAHAELKEAHQHLKATQAQLVQQEKMASLGQLTAGIAHEIKNPLNFINNFAEMVGELVDELGEELDAIDGDSGAVSTHHFKEILSDLKRNAEYIAKHGQRADGIVSSMMQHASGGSGQRERVEVNQLVAKYVDLAYHGRRAQAEGFNCEIERDPAEDVGFVEMIPQEIGRVLLNLLSNAFDAVSDANQPSIRVQTRRKIADSDRDRSVPSADAIEIRITDNGPGIPKDLREKIFEPFYTTKPTGQGNTGLGLSLSYDIVTQGHGGTLTVESEPGAGATFVIRLPG